MRFNGRTAVVTASGAGIGAAVAERLAREGAAVVVSDVDDDSGRRVVDSIFSAGGRAAYRRADVADEDDVRELVQFACTTFGGLHLAVNNAGVGAMPKRLAEVPADEWDRAIGITLRGTWLSMKAELGHFVGAGGGAIVNIASIAGLQSTPNLTPYGAGKHGVVSLTQSAAVEYAADAIRINAIAPGAIETAALASLPDEAKAKYASDIPMRRLGTPAEVAGAAAWLLSDEASFITGVTLPVDGGTLHAK